MIRMTGPVGAFLTVLAAAPAAHATLFLQFIVGPTTGFPVGSTTTSCGSSANPNPTVACAASVTVQGVTINGLTANTNAPGTPSLALGNSASTTISNASGADRTIEIEAISTDFTSPTAPPLITFLSHIGGTVVVGNADNTLNFVQCLDQSNSSTFPGCPGVPPAQTTPATPSITTVGSYQNDQTGTIALLNQPYALDELLTITLGNGSIINFSASGSLAATPEPMSVALLGGVLVLAGGMMRRKRKQVSQARV